MYRNRDTAASGPFATETDLAVGETIDLARALGAQVILGPLLDPNYALSGVTRAGYPGARCLLWRSGKNPAATRPADCDPEGGDPPKQGRGPIGRHFTQPQWDAWFKSYSVMMVGYARLADKHGAAVLIIAAEMWAAMTNKPNIPRWRKLVVEIRAVYKGKLAVAANANVLIVSSTQTINIRLREP